MKTKKYPQKWTEKDFESMSWYDNYIHSISFNHEGYNSDLILGIDYILEWKLDEQRRIYQWTVAPAILTFHNVNQLLFDIFLNFQEGIEINWIEQEKIITLDEEAGIHNYKWVIQIHSSSKHDNKITFESTGFDQVLTGNPVITPNETFVIDWNKGTLKK